MKRASAKNKKLLEILREMESLQTQYPEELHAARRASFLEQVAQSTLAQEEKSSLHERDVVDHLRNLGAVPVQYPPRLLAARRGAFARQIVWLNFVSMITAAWLAIQKRIAISWRMPEGRALPAALLTTGLALAVFLGFVFYANQKSIPGFLQPQHGTVQSGRIITANPRAVSITCKSGAKPPLCLVGEYKTDDGLAYQGNGSARPAVSKDSMPTGGEIHKAAYVNDGRYGPGASWISNSRNSWIKIDLGKATEVNTVTFGRDRLGKLSGHNPGQFVVALALADDVYANGNNSNDNKEYQSVYNSIKAGFSGRIAGADTVVAQFTPQKARYIKITFENKGAAIDEVQAFMDRASVASSLPGSASHDKGSKDDSSPNSSALQAASPAPPAMTATLRPVNTATALPTATAIPSETTTPIPTATVVPTNTPIPTNTAIPTSTSVPPNTPTSAPSDTPLPPPTSTPAPPDTDTPAPTDPATPVDVSQKIDSYDYLTSVPASP